jgi:hypothetical protein
MSWILLLPLFCPQYAQVSTRDSSTKNSTECLCAYEEPCKQLHVDSHAAPTCSVKTNVDGKVKDLCCFMMDHL